jgi:hypothetical protein
MEDRVTIGMISIMHGEIDYDKQCEYYNEFLYYFTDQVLQLNQEMKRQALIIIFQILLAKNYQDFMKSLDRY